MEVKLVKRHNIIKAIYLESNTTINKYVSISSPQPSKNLFWGLAPSCFESQYFSVLHWDNAYEFHKQHTKVLLFGHPFPIASESTSRIACRQDTDMS